MVETSCCQLLLIEFAQDLFALILWITLGPFRLLVVLNYWSGKHRPARPFATPIYGDLLASVYETLSL